MKKKFRKWALLIGMVMLIVLGIPSALSADASIPRKEAGLQSYPVADSATIYKGALVGTNSSGYLAPMSTTITLKFAGIAYEQKNNSGGSDGDLECRVYTAGVFKLTATSIAQTMVGQPMFATDDVTIDDTGTNYQFCGILVEYTSPTSGWVDISRTQPMRGIANDLYILTDTDTKNVRINSRDYSAESGDVTAVQIKPNVAIGGTTGVTGLEVSPRFASGAAGSKLVGIMSNPDLKGSSGNLSSVIRCYEAKFDGGTGRTVTGPAYTLDAMTANEATITGGCFVIGVQAAGGGGTGWTGLIRASASGAGGIVVSSDGMFKDPQDQAEAGYITIRVGSTDYEIPFYASS